MVGWFMMLVDDELTEDLCATKRVQFDVVAFYVCFEFGLADGRATWTDGRTSWRNNNWTGTLVWTLLWGIALGL